MEQDHLVFEMQAQLCQALGHAVRLRIVHALKEGPRCVNSLVTELQDIPQPTVSRHLAVLRSAGVLFTERKGMEVIYHIANPKIVGVCEMMRTILADRELYQLHIIQSSHT